MQTIEDALVTEPDQSLQAALDTERQTVAELNDQLLQLGNKTLPSMTG